MRRCGCGLVWFLLISAEAFAQARPNVSLQLPSFSNTGVDTTVVVPDRGTASLGGSGRAAAGSNKFNGLGPQRNIGLDQRAVRAGVATQIHDPAAEDRLLLEKARAGRQASPPAPSPTPLGRAARDAALPGVAELERQKAQRWSAGQREAYDTFARGQQAQAAGKNSVAAVYYRAARRQATGTLRQEIETQLHSLAVKPPGAAVNRQPSSAGQ